MVIGILLATVMSLNILIDQLKSIPDWRRQREVQHPLWLLILTSLLGVMSGYTSLRGLTDFIHRHYQNVALELGQTVKRVPSYNTIRRMMLQVDAHQVGEVFHQWVQALQSVPSGSGLAFDGKVLGSTVSDCQGAQQDYVSVVSASLHEAGWVVGQAVFQHSSGNEIECVRRLLHQLEVKGTWVTLDALHCQKNG